jgi:hypothetical protein
MTNDGNLTRNARLTGPAQAAPTGWMIRVRDGRASWVKGQTRKATTRDWMSWLQVVPLEVAAGVAMVLWRCRSGGGIGGKAFPAHLRQAGVQLTRHSVVFLSRRQASSQHGAHTPAKSITFLPYTYLWKSILMVVVVATTTASARRLHISVPSPMFMFAFALFLSVLILFSPPSAVLPPLCASPS